MTLRILAVSGSLQAHSSNAALLRALATALGPDTETTFTRALHELPPFNLDLDGDTPPLAVADWRRELIAADGVLVATPEYAFGLAGSLKNALDWVVSSGEFVNKPVALLSASTLETAAGFAMDALERTIRVMSADVVGAIRVPFVRSKLTPDGDIVDADLRQELDALARQFRERIEPRRS
ncbi:MAG TPA: NADPH-dependent FMN reductase [Gemmatimonadaceae bacterium]